MALIDNYIPHKKMDEIITHNMVCNSFGIKLFV